MSNIHPARTFNSLEQLLKAMLGDGDPLDVWRKRYWTKVWKRHVEKHGNVPLILKCNVCSGKEQKEDIKYGTWKVSRPSKAERDEIKGKAD